MKMFYYEIMKLFRQKHIYFGIAAGLIFSMLGFLYHLGNPDASAFEIPVTGLGNLVNTYFILFPLAFSGFLFSEEERKGTLKIIAAKGTPRVVIAVIKVIAACLFSLLVFLLIHAFLTVLGGLFFHAAPFEGQGGGVISHTIAFALVFQAFFFQWLGCLFLTALVLLWTIVFRSAVFGFGASLFSIIIMILLSNLDAFKTFLPLDRLGVWEHVLRVDPNYTALRADLSVLGIFTGIILLLSVIIWSAREVRN
ncbi:MAG: ABC transporter permease [Spirochaetia bacterium]